MRDIKFRGKRIDNNEWIYGSYGVFNSSHQIHDRSLPNHFIKGGGQWHKIIPETLGQYTGLKDKNGIEIYEGDILELPGWITSRTQYAICKWIDNNNSVEEVIGFAIIDLEDSKVESDEWDEFEIIGNIYENPELLKGE